MMIVFLSFILLGKYTLLGEIDVRELDKRNEHVKICAKRKILSPYTLVVDIKDVSEASPADLLRCILQVSYELKNNTYVKVEFAKNGESRYYIDGTYFKKLGVEYTCQNALYTMRELPQQVYTMQGRQPFVSTGTGLAALSEQIGKFNLFMIRWVE